jgi:phage shock protein A
MSIFQRTRILVLASVHDWFDRLERPEQTARHGLRELDRAITMATTATARSIAAQRILERHRDGYQRQIDICHERASSAAGAGNETAARRELAHQFELSQAVARLDAQLAEAASVNEQLRAQIQTMHARRRQEQDRLTMHVARHATASAARQMAAAGASISSSDTGFADVQSALERIDREAVEAEVEAELYLEICAKPEASIEAQARQRFIDEELSRLQASR